MSLIVNVLFFLGGIVLIVYSVEELVENLTKSAIKTGLSPFVLAVLFTGMDFENWAFGVASVLNDLPGVAVGSALGSGFFLVGVGVAAGGLFVPFTVNISKDYLLLLGLSPFLFLLPALDGYMSRWDGLLLMLLFAMILVYIFVEEKQGRETFRDAETKEAVGEVDEENTTAMYHLGFSALFVLGMIIGSELAVRGAEGIVAGLGLGQTLFGMTVVGATMSLEEVSLVVSPVRNNRTSIAAGNILGSMIFFATGNIGLLALTGSFPLEPITLSFYWPAFLVATLTITLFLWIGRVKRPEAILLASLYVLFWFISYTNI